MYDGLKNLDIPRRSQGSDRRRAHRHPWLRRLTAIGALFAVLAGGLLFWTYKRVEANLEKGKDRTIRELQEHLPGQPMNILILGSDRRDVIEGKKRNQRQYQGDVGQRADVMILLHIAAKAEKAVMVSLPRDLRVEVPGYGTEKLNAAYSFGGPNLTLKTVSRFTGININHYVEVNFASFQQIVNAIGGVDIYIDRPLEDRRSGLNIPRPGCIHMEGEQALSFVRARYIDPTADIGRIQRQQLFIRTLLRKVRSVGFILNIGKVVALSEAVGNGLRYDSGVDVSLGRSVANALASDQRKVDFRIVPSYNDLIGGISYLVPIEDEVERLFAAIRSDSALPDVGKTEQSVPKPRDVSLKVLNGSARAGLASREEGRLEKQGFDVRETGNASRTETTTILYEFGDELKAKLLQRRYEDSILKLHADLPYDLVLVVGRDHARRLAAEASGSPEPEPDDETPPATDPSALERSNCG